MAKIKLFDNWTWNRRLPEPFDDISIEQRSKTHYSQYCTTATKIATLHSAVLSAILAAMELNLDVSSEENGAYGEQGNLMDIAEYPSRTGEIHAVVYQKQTGKFVAGCYDDINQMPKPYVLKEDKNTGTALFFALIRAAMSDKEFSVEYDLLFSERKAGFPDLQKAVKSAYILCDNLYRRIENAADLGTAGIPVVIPSTGNIQPFTSITLSKGTYNPSTVLYGKFKALKPGEEKKKNSRKQIRKEDFAGKFTFAKRAFTSSEMLLIPKLPDWYVIPEEIIHICRHAQETTASNRPMRNFLLRGRAGTGKTEGAKAIAAGLGLPYLHLTCSANTEIFDLLGQMLPVLDQSQKKAGEYPTFEDIRMDTATAYYKLTGEYQEDVTEDMVYEKLLEVVAEKATHESGQKSEQRFQYVDSPLVKAMKKGYLIEIQEPTVISNPGVLVGLNSLLDTCSSVVLPTGERVERHPDTVVVITTNNDYEGCHRLNQSVLSRMDFILDMEEPDIDTLIERVSHITGCKERSKISIMAKILQSMQQHCRMNLIDDGCCGVREFISWVQSYMVCGDMMEAAKYTILPSVSSDEENREEIITTCLDPVLNP